MFNNFLYWSDGSLTSIIMLFVSPCGGVLYVHLTVPLRFIFSPEGSENSSVQSEPLKDSLACMDGETRRQISLLERFSIRPGYDLFPRINLALKSTSFFVMGLKALPFPFIQVISLRITR